MADVLEADLKPITSPVAIYEAALAIHRKRQGGVTSAEADIDAFLRLTGTRVVPLAMEQAHEALRAFTMFGRGSGHPAKLNMATASLTPRRAWPAAPCFLKAMLSRARTSSPH